jgi:pilin isopeptide linkage protein
MEELGMNKSKRIGRMVLCLIVSFVMIMTLIPRMPAGLAYAAAGDTPPHSKTLADNGDGTYTISLDVVGESEKKPNNVNVVVVFDTSGSMTTSRMNAAKTAVNSLASSLFAYNTSSAPNTVEMALVDFSTDATTAQAPTNSETTFNRAVRNLSAEGGTNWEAALKQAKNVDFGDDDQTFVIFVSDGNPTFRDTRGNYDRYFNYYGYRIDDWQYYNSEGVYGTGSDDYGETVRRCYNEAVDDAKALATSVGTDHFFAIGAFGNVDRMEQLTDDAGSDSTTNYYNASDTAALNQAISDILAKIEMSGIANASIDDGTTNQVKTTSGEVAELLEVDESSFKYYKGNSTWADAPEAHLVNGAVEWDISEAGVLENGVRYRVTFDCYPSQYTYDTIAKLKNGDITYDSLDPEVKKYIVDNGGGSYSLLTNTNATLSYDDTRDDADQKTVDYKNPDPVATGAATMSVTKAWENELDARAVGKIDMTVLMDKAKFHDVTLSKDDDPAWTKDNIFISPGIIKNGQVLKGAEGHDFTFAELGSEQYNWELVAPTVHPMIIDGTLTMLTMVDEAHPAPSGAKTYTINNKTYFSNGKPAASLDAYNYRRSNLNLTKVVTGEDAPKDATFPFTLTVNNGKASTGSADDTNSDYYVWFSIDSDPDPDVFTPVTDAEVSGTGVVQSGNYWYAPSGTAITVQMKADWNLRFTNLPTDTTYTFAEGDLAEGFAFNKAELTSGEDSTFNAGKTTTGTVEATNTTYTVTFTNDYKLTDLEITKVWEDNNNQDGKRLTADELKAKLTLSPAVEGKEATVTDNGDGTYTIKYTGLPRFSNDEEVTYEVTESAVDGYTTTGSPAEDHGTITNTHEPEVIDIDVEKVWVGPAGDAVTVTLYADHKATDKTLTLSAQNQWKGTFKDLPVYAAGKEIEYSVVEDGVSGVDASKYTTTIEGDAENGFTITNTNTETVDVTATKTWSDANNQDGKRPAELELTVNGLPDGKTAPEPTIIKDGNNWTYTWFELPKYKADGTLYTYTVSENAVPQGYTKSPEDPVPSGGTITNSYTPEVTTVSVTKAWADANNQDGKRPDDLTLTLNGLPDGVTAPEPTIVKDGNNWTYTWSGLPRYANGNEIAYTVTEGTVPEGYEVSYGSEEATSAPAGGTITNTHTPEKTEVTVTKIWAGDEEWKDSVRPDSVTVSLLADGKAAVDYDGKAVAPAPIRGESWTYTFTNLPKYKDGDEIVYTVQEEAVAGYTTAYSEDTFEITNTYAPTPTTATFDVDKNLVVPTGLTGPEEWSYTINAAAATGAPAVVETNGVTVDQDNTTATFTFAEDAFKKPGTYTYTVTEAGTVDGVTNDGEASTGKTVTIAVTGDKQGNLTAAVTGADEGGETTTFTNRYAIITPDTVDPPVKKELAGTELSNYDGQFTFKIEGKSAPEGVTDIPMPANNEITNSAEYLVDGFYEFGEIEYTVPGTYTYEISEVSGTIEEITYDTTKYTMTVNVVDNGDGSVTATMTPAKGSFVFNNSYSAEGSATLEATKVLEGREWKEGETFTFELRDANGATVGQPVQVSKDNPTASFNVAYTLADVGEHKYTITETNLPANEGLEKSADIEATVTVADAGEGVLSTDVAYTDNVKTITNTYTATAVNATVNVSKTIDGYIAGEDKNGNVVDRKFNFTMTGPKIDGELTASITTSGGQGTTAFDEIQYTLADMVDEEGNYVKTKDFVYTVTETAGDDDGFSYDSNQYTVTVTVTDDQKGMLTSTVKYTNEDQTSVDVVNEYEMTDVDVTLTLTKTIDDQSNSAPDGTFTFKLYKDSVSEDNFVEEKTITTKGLTGSVDFSELTFDAAGEYTYVVVEEAGDVNGFTYDTTEHTYKIVVDNDFEAAVLEINNDDSTLAAEITNVYKATAVSNALKVKKEVNDTSGSAYDTNFTFTLTDVNGEEPKELGTVTVKAGEEGTFEAINYEKAGTYEYTIKETEGNDPGYQYDTTAYKVTVTVEDVDGDLVATAAYVNKEGEALTSLTVTNTYDPEDAKIVLEARKVVDDKTGGATPKTFTFELKDADGKVVDTKYIEGGGTVTFTEQTYSKIGEYKYTVQEVAGSDKGYTYDTKEYPVTVTVTDPDKKGVLKAEATEGAKIEITNTYEATPTEAVIELSKELTGRALNEGEFTFTLTDVTGEEPVVVGTATNTADGKVVFDKIDYTVSGEYKYEVTENVPEETKGVTYDQKKIAVTVNVIDDGEGALAAEVKYPEDAAFKNEYKASGEFTPEAKKILTGKALADGQFSFKIEGPEVNETVKNKADGTVTFGALSFDQTDAGKTYEYTITEVNDKQANVTYDGKKVTLKVTITDNGDGTLKVTGEYSGKAEFNNTYKEEAPKMGDTTMIAPYIVIGAASLALLLMLLFRRRKAN